MVFRCDLHQFSLKQAGVAEALKDATEETFDLKRPNKIDLGPLTMVNV